MTAHGEASRTQSPHGKSTAATRSSAVDHILFLAFLLLIAVPLRYLLRSLDDNTLVSWQWIVTADVMFFVLLGTAGAAAAAAWLARVDVPARWHEPLLLALSFCAVVPLWSEPEVIIDASRYFVQAKHLGQYGPSVFLREWGGAIPAWTDLPAIPFAYGLIFRSAGESRVLIQLFTTLLFCCTAVLTCRLGRKLWDEQTGLLSGLLFLGSPYVLLQVPLMLVDIPLMFLFMLSCVLYCEALQKGGPARIVGAASAMSLAVLSKYSALPMLLILPVISFVSVRSGERRALGRTVAVLGTAGVLSACAFLAFQDIIVRQLALLRSFQVPALGRWNESVVSTALFQIHPFLSMLAIFGAVNAFRTRDIRFLVPFWLVVFAAGLQVGRIRYLVPLFPLLAVMAAYGLAALFRDRRTQLFTAYGAVGATLVLVLIACLPFLNRTTMANLRDAARYVDTLPGTGIAVCVLPQLRSSGNTEMAIPLLDLYSRKNITYLRSAAGRPSPERMEMSPLRFTWETPLPSFYDMREEGTYAAPLVVISGEPGTTFFPGLATALPPAPVIRTFALDTGTFRYRTAVAVAQKGGLSGTAQQSLSPVPFRTMGAAVTPE